MLNMDNNIYRKFYKYSLINLLRGLEVIITGRTNTKGIIKNKEFIKQRAFVILLVILLTYAFVHNMLNFYSYPSITNTKTEKVIIEKNNVTFQIINSYEPKTTIIGVDLDTFKKLLSNGTVYIIKNTNSLTLYYEATPYKIYKTVIKTNDEHKKYYYIERTFKVEANKILIIEETHRNSFLEYITIFVFITVLIFAILCFYEDYSNYKFNDYIIVFGVFLTFPTLLLFIDDILAIAIDAVVSSIIIIIDIVFVIDELSEKIN